MIRALEGRAVAGLESSNERDPLNQAAILVSDNPLLSLGVHVNRRLPRKLCLPLPWQAHMG